jgi:hypothetical protein
MVRPVAAGLHCPSSATCTPAARRTRARSGAMDRPRCYLPWRNTDAMTTEGLGSSWAIPARRTAIRAGPTPYTVEEARAGRFDTPDLAENDASTASYMYQIGPSDDPYERRVDQHKRQ